MPPETRRRGSAGPRRVAGRLGAALLAALASACTSPAADAPAPPPPAPGAALAVTLAGLAGGAPEGASLRVDELRLLRVDVEPWEALDPESLAPDEAAPGMRQAVIAHRTCRLRAGLRTLATPRASWLLFRDGRLEAFDHWSFGPACAGEHHFRPARGEDVALERDLVRYVAQRFPAAAPSALDRLAMGHAYLEAGRLDDAEAMLTSARRRLDDLAPTPGEAALPEEERTARAAEAEALRRAAASLHAELRAARRRAASPR